MGINRILMIVHYVMDVMDRRMLGLYDPVHLLANDLAYMGHSLKSAAAIKPFRPLGKRHALT